MMNEFQLQMLRTGDLLQLREHINKELLIRKKQKSVNSRIELIEMRTSQVPSTHSILPSENSKEYLHPPSFHRRKWAANSAYLPQLLAQDWSHIFGERTGPAIYYVYAHVNPKKAAPTFHRGCGKPLKGVPFYIGKGCGDRAFNFKRNQGHGKMLDHVLGQGFPPEIVANILFENLTESEAFEIESKLIFFFGTIYQKDRKFGCLYNLDIPKTPVFVGEMATLHGARRPVLGTPPTAAGLSKGFA